MWKNKVGKLYISDRRKTINLEFSVNYCVVSDDKKYFDFNITSNIDYTEILTKIYGERKYICVEWFSEEKFSNSINRNSVNGFIMKFNFENSYNLTIGNISDFEVLNDKQILKEQINYKVEKELQEYGIKNYNNIKE